MWEKGEITYALHRSIQRTHACFYSYGSDHQECLVHIERYLRDSIENEKGLTWNRQMLELIQEMIHENNIAPADSTYEK